MPCFSQERGRRRGMPSHAPHDGRAGWMPTSLLRTSLLPLGITADTGDKSFWKGRSGRINQALPGSAARVHNEPRQIAQAIRSDGWRSSAGRIPRALCVQGEGVGRGCTPCACRANCFLCFFALLARVRLKKRPGFKGGLHLSPVPYYPLRPSDQFMQLKTCPRVIRHVPPQ